MSAPRELEFRGRTYTLYKVYPKKRQANAVAANLRVNAPKMNSLVHMKKADTGWAVYTWGF